MRVQLGWNEQERGATGGHMSGDEGCGVLSFRRAVMAAQMFCVAARSILFVGSYREQGEQVGKREDG